MPECRRALRERSVAAGLGRFCAAQGIGDGASRHLLIEAYCAVGLCGRTTSTKGTYRSVLRRGGAVVVPARRLGYRGARAKAPYSASERAELAAVARLQPKRWRAEAALVLVALGIGSGLRAAEIVAARGDDVSRTFGTVVIGVDSGRARSVVIEEPFGALAAELATRRGAEHLFRPGTATRRYHNFVNDLCASLVADPDAVRLSLARCRSSYICDRLAAGVALGAILGASGICEVESLLRYAFHVGGAPATKAELRRLLEDQRRR